MRVHLARNCCAFLLVGAISTAISASPVQYAFDSTGNLVASTPSTPSTPAIVAHPKSQLGIPGHSSAFVVVATGSAPLNFQWQFNSNNISGAAADTLFLTNIALANFGTYRVVVSNALGSVTSSNAWLQLDSDRDGMADSWETNYLRGTNTFFYHSDDSGNVFALTDSLGVVVERYEYGDFGEPEFFDGAGASIPQSEVGNPYLFNGLRYDSESGCYWDTQKTDDYASPVKWVLHKAGTNPLRLLDPRTGRFLTRSQPDGSGNAYGFAGNNPWQHTQEYRAGKWTTWDYTFESPSHQSSGANMGSWSKAGGVDVVWDAPDYQPSSSGWYVSKPFVRVSAFRPGQGILKSTDDGRTWSHNNAKAFQIISAGKDNALHDTKDNHRVFRSRSGHLLEQASAGRGHSGWTGWSSFYRSFAIPESPAGVGRSVKAHPDFVWLPNPCGSIGRSADGAWLRVYVPGPVAKAGPHAIYIDACRP